ncbi:MAG: hypothetical protein IIC64_06555 [SAR324 cluster bacterium]|nr:hypothetical protein [SAR324 cluster bacterium]
MPIISAPERVSPMAVSSLDRYFIFPAVILLLGFLLSACASGAAQDSRLPNFPDYKPAEDFLILQKRLERYRRRPRPSPVPRFNDRSRFIYRKLKRQQALARGELKIRAQQQRDFENLKNLRAGQNFETYQNRVAQAELNQALLEEANQNKIAQNNRDRYGDYQKNLQAKRLEQQAIESIRAQEVQKLRQRNAAFISQSPGGLSVSPFSGGPTTQ